MGLLTGGYTMLEDDPEHCAETMLSVLESLWKVRTELEKFQSKKAIQETRK